LNAVDTPGMMIRMRWASWTKGIRLWERGYKKSEHKNIRVQDFKLIKAYAEKGIFKPIIDRSYPLEEIVEAHRYVEKGHKKGNVTISVG
jgi:NADPH:quinone reductase-like Zn-dependent oxidoreductase